MSETGQARATSVRHTHEMLIVDDQVRAARAPSRRHDGLPSRDPQLLAAVYERAGRQRPHL